MPTVVLALTDRGTHTITISDDAGHTEELDFPYFEATRCVRIASLLQGFLTDPRLHPPASRHRPGTATRRRRRSS
jgi:hypothetical protein